VIPFRERFRREVLATIAEAAEEVVSTQGLRDAHVGQIAKRAGVAVGTLYNYHKDRDAIVAALVEQRRAELCAALDEAVDPATSFREQFLAFVGAYFEFLTTHRRFLKIFMEGELMHLQSTLPRAAGTYVACHKALLQRTEALVKTGVDTGAIRPEAGTVGPWLLLGMMRSIAIRDLREYKKYEPADAAQMVDIFLGGAS
jgi:TetR/AcrR family transcriptional regulator